MQAQLSPVGSHARHELNLDLSIYAKDAGIIADKNFIWYDMFHNHPNKSLILAEIG